MADVGLTVLDKIHKQLLMDELWTIRGERKFSWVGHRLQQTIQASRQFDDEGIKLSRLTASSMAVKGVAASQSDVLRILSRVNRHAVGSAYTYWPATGAITSDLVAYVHDETLEWRSKEFASLAILQLCLGETEADWLADKTGGAVAVYDHPISGRRVDLDDMLNVLDFSFAPAGRPPSLFADKFEMETIAEITKRSTRVASFGGGADGVSLEVSFGDGTSLTMINSDEPHRRLGNGLTARLHLPTKVTPEDADRIATALNSQEATGGSLSTHYGSWCWDEWRPGWEPRVAYQTFIPNALHQQGIAQDVAYSCVWRAKWIDRVLNGKSSEANVWQTLMRRYGVRDGPDKED